MEMDWESLLDELWSYAASDPNELETKIRSCLKGHSSEGLLQAISLLIAQGQHATARTLLSEFLKNHHAVDEIQRRFELILHFKKHRAPQTLSIKSKQRGKEILLREVNELVASGKLQAAESLLLEAIETIEEPDYLNVLSRVYMLQRRPVDGARAMQRALLLKRQQQAFVEVPPEESLIDDLPTDSDLAFLNNSAVHLTTLEGSPDPTSNTLAGAVDDSINFIQRTASQYPPLNSDGWWEDQPKSASSEALTCVVEPDIHDLPDASPTKTEAPDPEDEAATSALTKAILSLTHPRKTAAPSEEVTTVKVFNKSGRSLSVIQPAGLTTPEPLNDSPSQPTPSPVHEVSAPTSEVKDEGDDENDEDDEDQAPTVLELNKPDTSKQNLGLEDPADGFDLDHDLQDLSIIEPGAEYEEETSSILDDFRDIEDDYAAYVFDPEEVFCSDEPLAADPADPADWLADRLSREDRALQKAAELVGKANWSLSTLPLIQQIFVMSGWGQTRLALEREIEKGLTPEELILAAHIKVIWAENDIYWVAFDKTGSSRPSHHVLSWPTALLVVRSFESLPQVEEIEVFLEGLFESWYENTLMRRAFKAFARYLWFRFANLEGCLPANQPFDFCIPSELPAEEYSDLGLYDLLEIEKIESLRTYGVLQTKHPQEPGCYFSDKPAVVEAHAINARSSKEEDIEEQTVTEEGMEAVAVDTDIAGDDTAAETPRWSAPSLTSALHANATDQTPPRIEP